MKLSIIAVYWLNRGVYSNLFSLQSSKISAQKHYNTHNRISLHTAMAVTEVILSLGEARIHQYLLKNTNYFVKFSILCRVTGVLEVNVIIYNSNITNDQKPSRQACIPSILKGSEYFDSIVGHKCANKQHNKSQECSTTMWNDLRHSKFNVGGASCDPFSVYETAESNGFCNNLIISAVFCVHLIVFIANGGGQ